MSSEPRRDYASERDRIAAEEFLDRETEWDLARRWRDHGDQEARERILQAYRRMALSYAAKWSRSGLAFEDLAQEATIGLIQALDKFDPERGFGFSTFSRYHIISRIQIYMLENIAPMRIFNTQQTKTLLSRFSRIRREIEAETGEPLDDLGRKQICDQLNIDPEHLKRFERAVMMPVSVDAGAGVSPEDPNRPMELADGPASSPERQVLDKQASKQAMVAIHEAMAELPERESRILQSRHMSDPPLTLDVLSKEFGISRERVRQVELRALSHLRRRLKAEGITDLTMVITPD